QRGPVMQAARFLSNYARLNWERWMKRSFPNQGRPCAEEATSMATVLISSEAAHEPNVYKDIFHRQKNYFATNITRSYEWRVDQLNRLARLLSEHTNEFYQTLSRDFKTALSEKVFEVAATLGTIEVTKSLLKSWMEPTEAPVPKFLAKSGHKAMVYREPY